MTYRQAQALGGQVRDGERSQFAIFYKSYTKSVESPVRPGEALDEPRRVLRSYAVLSADQIAGLPADYHPAAVELVPPADGLPDRARQLFASLPARVHHRGDRAYYDPPDGAINLPLTVQYQSP